MNTERIMQTLPLLALIFLAMSMGMSLFKGHSAKSRQAMLGQRIGAFDIPVLNNPSMHFSPKDWEGKIVIINIFASWCTPCKAEHEKIMELSKSISVPVYGIDWRDKEPKATAWLQGHGNPYKLVGFDATGATTLPFGMTGVPETYVIDKEGVVRYHYAAALTEAMVKDDIIPLVEKLTHADEQK
jgi:cytochrome c biogenesis protein CcmG/thiol:disulfide interchange protein DsbE